MVHDLKTKIYPRWAQSCWEHKQSSDENSANPKNDKNAGQGNSKPSKGNSKKSNPVVAIDVVAALVIETPGIIPTFKSAVISVGTKFNNKKCFVADHNDFWSICDGHAEAVCYHFASVYLLSEIFKHNSDRS